MVSAQSSTPTSTLSYVPNTRIRPFPYLQSSDFAVLSGASVHIEFGFAAGDDKLLLDYQGEFDITANFNSVTGVLSLSGKAPSSVYMTAISSVIFYTSADDGQQRRITWNFGLNTVYSSLTGHYYEYNKHLTSWTSAKATCASRKMFGLQGYLATITSADEMASVAGKVEYSVYLGGSDATTENTWMWVTGPEAGTQFWAGLNQYKQGMSVNKMYSDWARFQPNNGGSGSIKEHSLALVHGDVVSVGYFMDAAVTGVAGYLCEYGGMDSDIVAATTSEYANTVVLSFSCEMFEDVSECNNNKQYGCYSTGVSCVQSECTKHRYEMGCVGDWKCQWAVDGMIGKCGSTRCGKYSNPDACAADDQCTAKNNQCKPAQCSDRTSANTCAQLSSCQYISGLCMSSATFGCADVDTVFMLDGSAAMNKTWNRFNSGFQGLIDTLKMTPWSVGLDGQMVGFVQYGPDSMLDARNQAAPAAQGKLRTLVADVNSDLEFQQNSYSPSSGSRQIASALNTAKLMLKSDTSATRKKVIVIFAAGDISDAAGVAKAGAIPADVTILGYAIKPSSQISNDGTHAMRSLKNLTANVWSISIMDVMAHITAQCMKSTPAGAVVHPGSWPSVPACWSYMSSAMCAADAHCGWDGATMSCKPSTCAGYPPKASRGCDGSCTVSGMECVQRCALQTTMTGCPTNYCMWSGSACLDKACIANPSEDSCIADSNACRWVGAVYTATGDTTTPFDVTPGFCEQMKCDSITDGSMCKPLMNADGTTIQCLWLQEQSKCIKDLCGVNSNRQGCETLGQCTWTAGSPGTCKLNLCGLALTEQTCGNSVKCMWSVATAPGNCLPAPCTGYDLNSATQAELCQADNACMWNPAPLKKCDLVTCAMLTGSGSHSCAKRSDCVWRNDQCKDNRFVQCPAIDVVVAVEATSEMAKTFGRHPNGFLGIIEQLRMWGNEMPFSVDALSSGFRIQLQLYGSNGAPSYPTGSTLFGEPSSDTTPWTGVGSYLHKARQYFEQKSNVPDNSDVQLVGVLNAAVTTFSSNAKDGFNRKRVMVILGHSDIADNSAVDLTKAVASLEKGLGVQIFTNLVRRFNSITNSEQKAAKRMAPFSTDPRSSHFAFTTIDTLRSQLLDNFCVPSSTVGQALQISRDKTLPCTWLDGQTECEIQGSCFYDKTATVVCPLPETQCPQLGCVALPESIAKVFKCKNCEIQNGAFKCSIGNSFPEPMGLCKTDKCMLQDSMTCGATSGCIWDRSKTKCIRHMCNSTLGRADCNKNLGCVYVDASLTNASSTAVTMAGCQMSTCGLFRAASSCALQMETPMTSGKPWSQCAYDTTQSPAICLQSRCVNSNASNCNAGCATRTAPGSRKCVAKKCRHSTQARCEMDTICFWNPDNGVMPGENGKLKCQERFDDCVLADHYSEWSTCSSSCKGGTQYKIREVYSVNAPGASSSGTCVAMAKSAGSRVGKPPNTKLVEIQQCASLSNLTCTDHCKTYMDGGSCAADISCNWLEKSCTPRASYPCSALASATECGDADGCKWDGVYNFCFPGVKACKNVTDHKSCVRQALCGWNTGAKNNMDASKMGAPSLLINPGQKAILVFPTLRFENDDNITGATVVIESNYSRGADILDGSYGNLKISFKPTGGVLHLSGLATVTQYIHALRTITFSTTSTSLATRTITWSLAGPTAVYSAATGHFYEAYESMTAISYSQAQSNCRTKPEVFGHFGYLAAIDSEHENTMVSTKLGAMGWITGEDRSKGLWRQTSGPAANTPFWTGGPYYAGGRPAAGMYANWMTDAPNASSSMGFANAFMTSTGSWAAMGSTGESKNYICEFGGLPADSGFASYQASGVTTVSAGGCIPQPCVWHGAKKEDCERDVECRFISGQCKVGCNGFAAAGDCSRQQHCKWDTNTMPAACMWNKCQDQSKAACEGTLAANCLWNGAQGDCVYRTGCAVHTGETDCSSVSQCLWNPASTGNTVPAYCSTKPCKRFNDADGCLLNAQCEWNIGTKACVSTLCKSGDASMCMTDKRCTWQDGMGGTAVAFTPGGASVLPFAKGIPVTNDIGNNCSGITVSIVQGFVQGSDNLFVKDMDNIAGNFKLSFNRMTGVFVARVVPGVVIKRMQCFTFMQKSIRFYSASNTVNSRRLSFTLGADMTVGENSNKLYKYVKKTATSFASAQAICMHEASAWAFTGGKVAQIASQIDNLRLKALGAQGWLSATVQTDSQAWYWPNATSNFWTGAGAAGKLTDNAYAQWAGGEPRGATAGTSRAFLVNSGFWKVVNGGPNSGAGVICQFDVPQVIVTSSRNAAPFGCFVSACLGNAFHVCSQDPQCVWQDNTTTGSAATGRCSQDTWCTGEKTPKTCGQRELCFFDYDLGVCRTSPSSKCSAKATDTSCKAAGCKWADALLMLPRSNTQDGVCHFGGCAQHPAQSPCTADPTCRWASNSLSSACVPRQCGYLSESQCWSDRMCRWDMIGTRCQASACVGYGPKSADCSTVNSCAKTIVNNAEICGYSRCSTTMGGEAGKLKCEDDSSCLWNAAGSSCASAGCDKHNLETACNADKACYFSYNPNRCIAAQCTSNTDLDECEDGELETSKKPCIWNADSDSCRQPTFAEQNAPASNTGVCEREEYGNLVWLWILAVLILILVIAIFYRLYLAYKHGVSFFEASRNTKSFSPHSGVGEDVFEEAQRYGEETNVQTSNSTKYTRPSADEL